MIKHLKILVGALVALACSLAHADAYWLWQQQRNATDTGYTTRLLPTPSGVAVVSFDPSTQLPGYLVIGTSLSTTSGVLNVVPGSGQVNSDWNATSGAAQILNKPTITAFNFGLPAARTLAVSTDYQANDPTKAEVITPSYSCTNATTVTAASGCTLQVRMGAAAITCSTGIVLYTQSLTVQLGVLITQASTNPVQINLPIGAHFIICPTTGTFTVSATEQTAG